METHCKKCGQEFKKFGYLASDDPLCPECREELEENQEEDHKTEGSHPLSFVFGDIF